MMIVNQLSKETIDDVLRIAKERNLSHSLDKQVLIDALDKKNHLVLVGSIQGITIGYVLATLELDEAEIDSVAVSIKYEGNGYGRLLMEEMIKELEEMNVNRILLEVNAKNERAKNLYINKGFKTYRIRKGYYNGIDALCMEWRKQK